MRPELSAHNKVIGKAVRDSLCASVYGINGFSFALTFFTTAFFIDYREDMASPPPTRKSPRKPHPIPPPFDPSLPNLQPLNLFRNVPLLSVEPNDEVPETPPPSMADQCDAIHVEVMQKDYSRTSVSALITGITGIVPTNCLN
jgi:hypothetical protein